MDAVDLKISRKPILCNCNHAQASVYLEIRDYHILKPSVWGQNTLVTASDVQNIGFEWRYIFWGRIVLILDKLASRVHQNNEFSQNISP